MVPPAATGDIALAVISTWNVLCEPIKESTQSAVYEAVPVIFAAGMVVGGVVGGVVVPGAVVGGVVEPGVVVGGAVVVGGVVGGAVVATGSVIGGPSEMSKTPKPVVSGTNGAPNVGVCSVPPCVHVPPMQMRYGVTVPLTRAVLMKV